MASPVDAPDTGPGIARRALIRRAAVAGVAAWTAPAILGSVASPAGAVTRHGCFQVNARLNDASGATATWSAWASGPADTGGGAFGTTCGSPLCPTFASFTTAPADLLAALGAPTPANAPSGTNAVVVSAPSGCTIVGVGVTPAPSTFGIPDCGTTSVDVTTITSLRYRVTGIGTGTVTITPNGNQGFLSPNSGFWDSDNVAHSTITLSLSCT